MADTHIALAVIFDVPAGEDFKSYFPKFYAKVKAGTKDTLYYGFATCGNKVLCREGYKNAAGMLAHTAEVKDELEGMIKKIGKDKVKILCSGPPSEIEKIKPHMDGRLPIKFVDLDAGSLLLNAFPKGCADSHVTILPEFIVPAGKVDEFKAGFPKFYAATKNGPGAAGCLYYGFGFSGESMYCREGYKSAEDCMKHGADVKDIIDEPLKAVGAANFKLNVVGPAAELEKLKPKLAPRGAVFWELDAGAFWM
eukprot:TRINITY_DN3414_c0_g1_i1.p1 TRINITY_DN3414_c0_g1~~TRINITY_DN3414_c0_g1_i1.p1  ORF type:complete len:252 (-),score=73.63 TRINITY_DN3414_c0_g1_i1:121-876(-)